jgi:hypothetical protein
MLWGRWTLILAPHLRPFVSLSFSWPCGVGRLSSQQALAAWTSGFSSTESLGTSCLSVLMPGL